jgi:membrane-associated phospholipid phosphatase
MASTLKNKVALLVSRLFDPIVETPFILFLATQMGQTQRPWWQLLLLSFLLVYFLPYFTFIFSLKKKWISDFDITKRQERYGLFILIFISILVLLLLLYLLQEQTLFNFYLKIILPVFIFFIITFFWKISGHMLVNTILILLLYLYFNKSIIIIMGLFMLVAVGWSRLTLRKHTLSQVIAGILLPLTILI